MSIDFILKILDDYSKGYRLEVDLHCPVELHDKFQEFPPALETLMPDIEWLTPYQREKGANTGIIHNGLFHGTNILVPLLYDRKIYVIHYKNLKNLESLGVQVTKKHKVKSFSPSLWLKPHIDFNAQKRAQTKHELKKAYVKVMNNSVFGKCMENVKKCEGDHERANSSEMFFKKHIQGRSLY